MNFGLTERDMEAGGPLPIDDEAKDDDEVCVVCGEKHGDDCLFKYCTGDPRSNQFG